MNGEGWESVSLDRSALSWDSLQPEDRSEVLDSTDYALRTEGPEPNDATISALAAENENES